MGFQETRSEIGICNKALSRVKQVALSGSLDDPANLNKHPARECRLWYKSVVRQVLSMHHFGLATKRVQLVSAPENSRSAEWVAAHLPPSDMAFPVLVKPFTGIASTVSYYVGIGFILARLYGRPLFLYQSGVIYSQIADAELEYVSFDITEQDFNEAVEALVVLFLASNLARSVAKDDKLGADLHNEATARLNIEIARNLNMNQPRYDLNVSETELARAGYDPGILEFGQFR
jgi:hypothetical protein